MQQPDIVFGVDVGASGIKGGLVNLKTGRLVTERHRLDTPQPATPAEVTKTFAELINMEDGYNGIIGVGFPAIVQHGVAKSAANVAPEWIGTSIAQLFSEATGCPVYALNDADAAGIATMKFGTGRGEEGLVLMLTIGSGLGTAMFIDGELVPNTEFGHVYLREHQQVAEKYVSNRVRKEEDMPWDVFGERLNTYLHHINRLVSPDLIILGGGASKNYEEYGQYLTVPTRIKAATLENQAGTVGAAYYANLRRKREKNPTD